MSGFARPSKEHYPSNCYGGLSERGGGKCDWAWWGEAERYPESRGNCFIRHDREVQKFVVTADDHESRGLHTLIERAIQKYNDTKYKWETPNPTDSDERWSPFAPTDRSLYKNELSELLEAMFKSGPVKQGLSEREVGYQGELAESKNPDGSKRYEPYWGYDPRGEVPILRWHPRSSMV